MAASVHIRTKYPLKFPQDVEVKGEEINRGRLGFVTNAGEEIQAAVH